MPFIVEASICVFLLVATGTLLGVGADVWMNVIEKRRREKARKEMLS
jgi:uncharacterized membrane protein YidH (DUF202 family)